MKKIFFGIVLVVAMFAVACSDNREDKNTSNSDVPVESELPKQTQCVDEEEPEGTTVPVDTQEPIGTSEPSQENDVPEDTSLPDNTTSPDSENPLEDENSDMNQYEYVVTYKAVEVDSNLDYESCKAIINERINILGIPDAMAWVENGIIHIGYNNNNYKEIIGMIAQRGEIHFRYKNDYVLFDNKEINKITEKKDYKGDSYLIFELFNAYAQEFAQFTQEHVGGEFVLLCDGQELMTITIDMVIENGVFSVKKVPDVQVLDMLSIYIQSGTIISLQEIS